MFVLPIIQIPVQLADKIKAAFDPARPHRSNRACRRCFAQANEVVEKILERLPVYDPDSDIWDGRRRFASGRAIDPWRRTK